MGISLTYDSPYYSGSASSSLVPGSYPIALNGRTYLIDTASKDWHRQSIPLVRNQADTGNIPGEQTINPEDLWRRAQDNWTHGAGQLYLDRIDPDVQTFHSNRGSDGTRFHASSGIDPWSRWHITLQPKTRKIAPIGYIGRMVTTRNYIYYTDGADDSQLKSVHHLDSPVIASVGGLPGSSISAIATDGRTIWVACGANGIYKLVEGGFTATQLVTTALSISATLSYANGRLMLGNNNSVYNITDLTGPSALPAALLAQPNTDFSWVGFTEGPGYIYAAGYSGHKSLIYKIGLTSDASSLSAPVVAGLLPDTEIVYGIQGYLDYLCIGTNYGVRFAEPDASTGNVTMGSLIPSSTGVASFAPQDRFVYFGGWPDDATNVPGLGRMDLSQFTAPLTPAYAADLQSAGPVEGLGTFLEFGSTWIVFSVLSDGIYAQHYDMEPTGYLDTGLMTFGLPDQKIGMYVDVRHEPMPIGASVQVMVAADNGDFVAMGTNTTVGSTGFTAQLSQLQAELFEVRIVLNYGVDTSPAVTRVTMRAYPAPNRNQIITVPLLFYDTVEHFGPTYSVNPKAELANIVALINNKRMVPYQEGAQSDPVFVDDYEWAPDSDRPTQDGSFFNGTCTVKLKIISQ